MMSLGLIISFVITFTLLPTLINLLSTEKNNIEGVYGISMRQSYTSTNYSDEGYLFLLIDFNDDKPKIYVRAWQPKEWSDDALVELGNFNVNY